MKKIIKINFILFIGIISIQCSDDLLEPKIYGESYISDNISNKAIQAIRDGVYSYYMGMGIHPLISFLDYSGDHIWNERGAHANQSRYYLNFNWDAQQPFNFHSGNWNHPYKTIQNANTFLEAIDGSLATQDEKKLYKAEGRFIRAFYYDLMHSLYGPVPLRTTSTDEPFLGRADENELLSFIETELQEAVIDLPNTTNEYGRITKGHAYGILMKHYLRLKKWDLVIESADKIDALGLYGLYLAGENPSRDLFKVENEGNEPETIMAFPRISTINGLANVMMAFSYPEGNYFSFVDGSAPLLPNQGIVGTKNRVYDFFYDSFHPDDDRRKQIIAQYINNNGDIITQPANRKSPFKYWPDPNANAINSGNDFKIIRYADVLLSKSEALNEINGPTQEALDLINQVRSRAKVPDRTMAEATSKEVLRDLILQERGWEFYLEGKRRDDLIRHGKFLEAKRNHPVNPANAEDFRVLFPIPQQEIDANPNIEQTPGY